jgi:heat shock protein HslJ
VTRFALFVLCGLAMGVVGGCGDDDGAPSRAGLAGTQWALDLAALGVPDAGSVSSWIAFAQDRVNGNDGCNSFSGTYQADGAKLTFGPLAGTRMACGAPADDVARKVTAALARVRSYERRDGALRMKDAGGATVLRYTAARSGVEGDWTVISVLYDDAIRSVLAGTEPTAEFSGDGRVTGSTGCNRFDGPYTLEGDKLSVGPLTAGKEPCPAKEAAAQEEGYLAALESAVRIEPAGPQLTLLNAKGQKAVTLMRR